MSERENLTLEVLGETLTVKSSGETGVTREAIERLEEKIQGIQESSHDASDMEISLLAALNLAGELVRLERASESVELAPDLDDRIRTTRDLVDQFLDGDADT